MIPELDRSLPPEDTGRFRRLHKIVPASDSEGSSLYRWRLYIGLSSYAHWTLVALILAAMLTGLPLIGQIAWANDTEKMIDTKIAQAVKPIEDRVAELAAQSKAQNDISKAFLARLAEDSIIGTLQRMCREPLYSDEWRRLNSDYERFRADYAKATGREYRPLVCGDAVRSQ